MLPLLLLGPVGAYLWSSDTGRNARNGAADADPRLELERWKRRVVNGAKTAALVGAAGVGGVVAWRKWGG